MKRAPSTPFLGERGRLLLEGRGLYQVPTGVQGMGTLAIHRWILVEFRPGLVIERALIGNIEPGLVFIPFHSGSWDDPSRPSRATCRGREGLFRCFKNQDQEVSIPFYPSETSRSPVMDTMRHPASAGSRHPFKEDAHDR